MKGSLWILPNVRSLEPSLPARDILTTVEMRYVTVFFFFFQITKVKEMPTFIAERYLYKGMPNLFFFLIYIESVLLYNYY